jgi:hypothetical protein
LLQRFGLASFITLPEGSLAGSPPPKRWAIDRPPMPPTPPETNCSTTWICCAGSSSLGCHFHADFYRCFTLSRFDRLPIHVRRILRNHGDRLLGRRLFLSDEAIIHLFWIGIVGKGGARRGATLTATARRVPACGYVAVTLRGSGGAKCDTPDDLCVSGHSAIAGVPPADSE